MTARSGQTLRDQHVGHTRQLICEAFAACLEDDDAHGDVSVQQIAERAGISDRTVYRHFPTRVDLLAGFADWTRTHGLPLLPVPTLDDLPAVFTEAMRNLDARPRMGRALAVSDAAREAFTGLTIGIREQLENAVDEAAPHLADAERTRAVAALSYLDSAQAWLRLRTDFGMDADEIGDVIGWVMGLVIESVHRSETTHHESGATR